MTARTGFCSIHTEAPTIETDAAPDEPEPSEYVKKLLRAAKRRARQVGEDDPDFAAPRSHHRKKPRLDREPEQETLENMDPALFNEDMVAPDSSHEGDVQEQVDAPAESKSLRTKDPAQAEVTQAGDNIQSDHRRLLAESSFAPTCSA